MSEPAITVSSRYEDAATGPIRCIVVDDHPAVRTGLRELLSIDRDFVVLDAFAGAETAAAYAEHHAIDVAVVDYQLGGRSGLWLSRRLRDLPNPPAVIIYSAFSDWLLVAACVVAGTSGLVSKSVFGDELTARIRAAARGEHWLPGISPVLGESVRRRLDAEELSVFGMMVAGEPADAIARTLRMRDAELDATLWGMLRKLERVGSDG
jgi:two-component system response regulator DevR